MKLLSLSFVIIILLTGCSAVTPPVSTASVTSVTTASSITEETESVPPETTEATTTIPFDPLEILLNQMSIEEKVGQIFLARCPDIDAVADISTYHLGGYILFGRDFENQTPDSIRQTLAGYQNAADIPLLIAVDEEGGTVCRISNHEAFRNNRFPSPRRLYEQGGLEAINAAETEKCQLLYSLGINVNMAPVCDITTDPNAFMFNRSLGQDAIITGQFIENTVTTMAENHIGSVLKHFPGYGNNDDTHVNIAIDGRKLEELENLDLIPFSVGIEADCDAILISHTIVECLDSQLPASLSPAVHQYLREEMRFDDVIITDDLVMDAISDRFGAEEAAVLAVLAGNDLLCSTEYQLEYTAVLQAVRDGRIPLETLDQAVMRILRWKDELGLLY